MPESRQSLVEHLSELRGRIIWSMLVWALASGLIYHYTPQILIFLIKPLGGKLYFTGLQDAFLAYFKLALLGGFFLALPFFLSQLYAFVRPGLTPTENCWAVVILFPAFFLFLAGAIFALLVIFPFAVKFFVSFARSEVLTPLITVSEYLGLATLLALLGGISFQLPLVMLFLAVIGLATTRTYLKYWNYAVIIAVIAAGVFTPTVDIFTQILVTAPLVLLYFIGILLCSVLLKR